MTQPETHRFAPAGPVPNSPLPLLHYRSALPADPDAIEQHFAANGWSNGWRNGIFPYHHFHSNAHEVLGIARGRARVRFGGPEGTSVEVAAGDVVVIPAGVGHCREWATADLLVIGAYPGGMSYDTRTADPKATEQMGRNAAAVPVPEQDPVDGRSGALPAVWRR